MYYSVIVIGHQSLVPPELRNIGLKVPFINSAGKVETWEFQGGTFTSAGRWKQIPNQAMIERIDNDIFNLNADKIDIDGTYDKEITLELSPSAVWQSLKNIFPEGKDCTIHIDNPNKQTIFLAFSSVSPYQGQQYFYPDFVIKGMNHETISKTGKAPNRSEYPYILFKAADDSSIKTTISAGENKNIFDDINKVSKNVNQKIEEQSQIILGIQDSIGGKEINVDIYPFKMQFQSLENTFPDNSTLNVDYAKTKAAWTEVYFSKSSDNNTDGVQDIYRSNKLESGSKQIVAPSPSDYPYIIYKGYDLDATISISYTFPTIDEKIEEIDKNIKLLNKLDTHIPTLQETASVSIMLDYIDAFFSWCDVANPMGIPITCCLNAFIYKNRSIQDKEKFKSLIQAGNGFIAHGWATHKGSNNFSDAEFEDTIKSAKEYFISQGLKTEG